MALTTCVRLSCRDAAFIVGRPLLRLRSCVRHTTTEDRRAGASPARLLLSPPRLAASGCWRGGHGGCGSGAVVAPGTRGAEGRCGSFIGRSARRTGRHEEQGRTPEPVIGGQAYLGADGPVSRFVWRSPSPLRRREWPRPAGRNSRAAGRSWERRRTGGRHRAAVWLPRGVVRQTSDFRKSPAPPARRARAARPGAAELGGVSHGRRSGGVAEIVCFFHCRDCGCASP
jgi:hypothetical protein